MFCPPHRRCLLELRFSKIKSRSIEKTEGSRLFNWATYLLNWKNLEKDISSSATPKKKVTNMFLAYCQIENAISWIPNSNTIWRKVNIETMDPVSVSFNRVEVFSIRFSKKKKYAKNDRTNSVWWFEWYIWIRYR